MLNMYMITTNGVQLEYKYKKHLSSPWQAVTDIANKYNMPIIDVFYCLSIGERSEILRQVEVATKSQSSSK